MTGRDRLTERCCFSCGPGGLPHQRPGVLRRPGPDEPRRAHPQGASARPSHATLLLRSRRRRTRSRLLARFASEASALTAARPTIASGRQAAQPCCRPTRNKANRAWPRAGEKREATQGVQRIAGCRRRRARQPAGETAKGINGGGPMAKVRQVLNGVAVQVAAGRRECNHSKSTRSRGATPASQSRTHTGAPGAATAPSAGLRSLRSPSAISRS
jgi:hypothetical protein